MNGQTEGRLNIDLMNSETRIGDYIGKQLAQRLPTLPPRVGNDIRGQNSAEILLESTGDRVFEGKRHWRCAEASPRNSSEVRILRQGLIASLPGLDGCSRCSCYFG
jgi:transposase